MIRHAIAPNELRRKINVKSPSWYGKARTLNMALPANPASSDFKSIWGDIKTVYMGLQGSKCMYCEMQVEGSISNDVEHFRPKAKVNPWKVPRYLAKAGLTTTAYTTSKGDPGYKNLAYHPWNYGASCKVCNSILKKNYFPICGKRQSGALDARRMRSERALFIYPIGDQDDAPETLIGFRGLMPEPLFPAGSHEYFRALATIEAFKLNDGVEREELFSARAHFMRQLFSELETLRTSNSASRRLGAQSWIDVLLDVRSPHSNCLRCFSDTYAIDRPTAEVFINDAFVFLGNRSNH